MYQKTQFIADYLREMLSITELCELYGINRKTAYIAPAVLYVRKRHMNGFGEAALVENRPWVTPQTSV